MEDPRTWQKVSYTSAGMKLSAKRAAGMIEELFPKMLMLENEFYRENDNA